MSMDFFNQAEECSPEVVQGLFREGQVIVLGGLYGAGKSPLLTDLIPHIIYGLPWCGLHVSKRPVIYFDFENTGQTFRENIRQTCHRLNVPPPNAPQDLEPYILHDSANQNGTKELLEIISKPYKQRIGFLRSKFTLKQNALLVLDPVEMFFPDASGKKEQVLTVIKDFRFLLKDFCHADILSTYNLRKKDRTIRRPSLFVNPREWLDEVAGSSDIMNRSDVRLGLDFYEEEVRVLNGIRRGESLEPILIEPIFHGEIRAGFQRVKMDKIAASGLLTSKQKEHWNKLPNTFTFEEGKELGIPAGSLSRLTNRCIGFGLMTHEGNTFHKTHPYML
jgi:hypothetical protein